MSDLDIPYRGAPRSMFITKCFSRFQITERDRRVMQHVWGRGEVHTGFRCKNVRIRDHWEDPGLDGKIILTFKPRIKSHLLFAGIIRRSPFSPR